VNWSEIQGIHLDRSAETGSDDRRVFCVERSERGTVSSGIPMGTGSTRRHHARLEQVLDQLAEAHGFEFEVTDSRSGRPRPDAGEGVN
jgi:hypothetical protein